jgi:hypothetical protein
LPFTSEGSREHRFAPTTARSMLVGYLIISTFSTHPSKCGINYSATKWTSCSLIITALHSLECRCDGNQSPLVIYEIPLAQVENVSVNAQCSDNNACQKVKLFSTRATNKWRADSEIDLQDRQAQYAKYS